MLDEAYMVVVKDIIEESDEDIAALFSKVVFRTYKPRASCYHSGWGIDIKWATALQVRLAPQCLCGLILDKGFVNLLINYCKNLVRSINQ